MQIYLPIAEVSVNIFLLLGLGGIVGVLSGMFGVGGGFLMTPLLFFIGIPPAVAVATERTKLSPPLSLVCWPISGEKPSISKWERCC